jgi:hypothetical protein
MCALLDIVHRKLNCRDWPAEGMKLHTLRQMKADQIAG